MEPRTDPTDLNDLKPILLIITYPLFYFYLDITDLVRVILAIDFVYIRKICSLAG